MEDFVEETCACLIVCSHWPEIGLPSGLAGLLDLGMAPWFWLDRQEHAAASRFGFPYWARVEVAAGTPALQVDGDCLLVRHFTEPDGTPTGIGSALRVPLHKLRFAVDDLKKLGGVVPSPIRLVHAPEALPSAGRADSGRQRRQEERILEILRSEGLNPQDLPARRDGKSGPKAMAKATALADRRLFTPKSFEKAWERLRSGRHLIGGE